MDLICFKKCEFKKSSLEISENISNEEWKSLGKGLSKIQGSVQIWLGDWAKFGNKKGFYTDTKTYKEISEITGYEPGTIKDFKYVAENVPSSVRTDDISFGHLKQVAPLEPEEQKEWLDRAERRKLTVKELRQEIKEKKYQNLKESAFPEKKYGVILADPPWEYSAVQQIDGKITSAATDHYPTMSIEQLCDLDIKSLAADDCVLFIWTTSPLLEKCFPVINAWSFSYRASFVWDKVKHNVGHYNSVRHEFLLIAIKGKGTPENVKLFDSVQSIEKTKKHSEKPKEFRDIIDILYPDRRKIELFARGTEKIKNWSFWGNEC